MLPSTTYGVATSDAGAPLTFTSTGTYTVLFKVSSYTWDIYSNSLTVNVVEAGSTPAPTKEDITLTILVDGDEDKYVDGEWTELFDIQAVASKDINGEIIFKEGNKEIKRANIDETWELDGNYAEDLGLGEHTISAVFEGNEEYNEANYTFFIDIDKKEIFYHLTIDDVEYPNHVVGNFSGIDVSGKFIITINETDYNVTFISDDEEENGGWVLFDIGQLPAGTYKVSSVAFEDNEHYVIGTSEWEDICPLPEFNVEGVIPVDDRDDVELNDTVLSVVNGTVPSFSIDLPGANGNLTVKVGIELPPTFKKLGILDFLTCSLSRMLILSSRYPRTAGHDNPNMKLSLLFFLGLILILHFLY